MDNFETYMTAHISKIVNKNMINHLPFNKQEIIVGIQKVLTCELYPIILKYVESNLTDK